MKVLLSAVLALAALSTFAAIELVPQVGADGQTFTLALKVGGPDAPAEIPEGATIKIGDQDVPVIKAAAGPRNVWGRIGDWIYKYRWPLGWGLGGVTTYGLVARNNDLWPFEKSGKRSEPAIGGDATDNTGQVNANAPVVQASVQTGDNSPATINVTITQTLPAETPAATTSAEGAK